MYQKLSPTPQKQKRTLSINDKNRIRAEIATAKTEDEIPRLQGLLSRVFGVSIHVISSITSKRNMQTWRLKNSVKNLTQEVLEK